MPIKMNELPMLERPYEKLEMYGAEKLTNAELLAIIIKTGTKNQSALEIAQKILNIQSSTKIEDLSFLFDISLEEFKTINGIGKVKAIQIKALCEFAKRISRPIKSNQIVIKNCENIAKILMPEMRYEKKENVKVVILNSKNIILKIIDVSLGGTNFACVDPKDVLSEAIKIQAPKIILVHNHPSGDPKPSQEDFIVTDRIYECANMMGIKLLDHIVIGNGIYESLLGRGLKNK